MRHTSRLIGHIVTYIAMQSATHTAKTPRSQIRRSKALSVSSPYNLPQETQNSLKTKEKRLKSNRKVNGDVQKKNKNKKILEMGGLGALLAYLGGGGYVATCWMYTQISQIKPIYDIIQVRRCNCKQQKRKRLKSHYIACNTDVSHINGNYTSYRNHKTPHNNQKTERTYAHRAYLNSHITCHATPHRHASAHSTRRATYITPRNSHGDTTTRRYAEYTPTYAHTM